MKPDVNEGASPLSNFPSATAATAQTKSSKTKRILLLSTFLLIALAICSVNLFSRKKSSGVNTITNADVQSPSSTDEKKLEDTVAQKQNEKPVQPDWSKVITVSSSNYGYGVLGGINNLSVLFSNKSDHLVDEVTAKVTYFKANGKPWKTKYISAFGMTPHSEKKQGLPKVGRGKSVEVKIHKVVVKKMQYAYTAK